MAGTGREEECTPPRGIIRPCVLLLLGEGPAHGYELVERLRSLGVDLSNPAPVYRTLHSLEESELVRSSWDTGRPGPARRVYELTAAGDRALETSAAGVHDLADVMRQYLLRYRDLKLRLSPAEERSFEVLVEATLSVDASDETSARQKAQDAFAGARRLHDDVWSKGQAWVYQAGRAEA